MTDWRQGWPWHLHHIHNAFIACVCCFYLLHLYGCIWLTCIQDLWHSRSDDSVVLIPWFWLVQFSPAYFSCIYPSCIRRLYAWLVLVVIFFIMHISCYPLSCWTHPRGHYLFQVPGCLWSRLEYPTCRSPRHIRRLVSVFLFIFILVYDMCVFGFVFRFCFRSVVLLCGVRLAG